MPVEVMEAEHPVRIEDYAFVPDSCGAGKWRGGIGIRRSYRILAPEALLQMRADRVRFRPYGLDGGEPGGPSRNFMQSGNELVPLPGKITRSVVKDTVIVHEQAGAGGFGNPMLRRIEDISEDLADGKITRNSRATTMPWRRTRRARSIARQRRASGRRVMQG